MDNQLKNFINQTKSIKMTAGEKSLLRSRLSSLSVPSTISLVRSSYLSKSHFFTFGKALVAACLIIALSGGSLSYAAEKSLPGEFLYPVKTDFNEKIISTLKIKPEDKLAWQEKRMERREKEIEELKKRNKFDDRAKLQVEKNFNKQIREVENIKIKNKTGPNERAGSVRRNNKN